jgi:Tfp pilus assembly protein PilO
MSDVNIAPAAPASAPSAPSAAPGEVPISPSPHTPTPVGQQAPPKPVTDLEGSPHRPQSRREVIQEAFRKAEDRGRPGPAQARMGHNQPPEEMKPERKPPPQAQRGEGGRFAPREQPPGASVQPGAARGAQPGQRTQQAPGVQHAPLPETAPFRQPPPRFDRRAQADWAVTPESVRANVARMHHEFGNAYRQYRADSEVMHTIRPFHQLATEQGTTLQRALHNYVNMEKKLREDAISGLDIIVNNLNLRDQTGRKLGLRDIAYYVLSQSPEAHRQLQQANQQQAQHWQLGALHQKIDTLAQGMQQMHAERQFVHTRSAVDQFADQHPRFDELGDLIEKELHLGFSLDQAYRRAELLRPPTTQAAQTRNSPAQTRTDRSISGAPDGPSNGRSRPRSDKPVERRTAIQNAINRVNGRL